jgi:hypothetical protein
MALGLHPKLTGGGWDEVLDGIALDVYSQQDHAVAQECLKRLVELGTFLQQHKGPLRDGAPKPRASMRIAPRI